MTEYDFSPEAYEAHIRKQHKIARWVDNTNQYPLRNPFTPATPAVQPIALQRDADDHEDNRRHRRRDSKEHHDRHYDRERERDRDRDGSSRHRPSISSSSSRPHTKRHRSASHSTATVRQEPPRSHTLPAPLQQSSPTSAYPQHPYPPRLTSPRDSKHSSHSSSTTRPQSSPTSYFAQQQPPYSAPLSRPVRAQTVPYYAYPVDAKYPYAVQQQPVVAFQNGFTGYPAFNGSPTKPVDLANAPQYPHSMYQTKPPPLLKRLFMGLTGGSKHQQHKTPRRKRSSSF